MTRGRWLLLLAVLAVLVVVAVLLFAPIWGPSGWNPDCPGRTVNAGGC